MTIPMVDARDYSFEPEGYRLSRGGILIPTTPLTRPPIGIDLFAGCGGFSLGMGTSFDVAVAVEWDTDAACTYALNLGASGGQFVFGSPEIEKRFRRRAKAAKCSLDDLSWFGSNRNATGWGLVGDGAHAVVVADVRTLTGSQLIDAAGCRRGDVAVVFGGPPCQGFSKGGKQDPADPRNNLVLEFLRLVDEIGPDRFCMENVPPLIRQPQYAPLWAEFQRRANEFGYDVYATILDAANYNVPQFRSRAFVFGTRPGTGPVKMPIPTTWMSGSCVDGAEWDYAASKGPTSPGEDIPESSEAAQISMFEEETS